MRELEKRIEQWRRAMRAKLPPEGVEELESHLRESMEEFRASGHDEVEAFELASKRMGSANEINAEFEKRNGSWWAIKVATIAGVLVALSAIVVGLVIAVKGGPIKWLLGAHVFSVTAGYVGVFLIGALGICFIGERLWRDFSPTTSAAAARVAVAFATAAACLTALGTGLAMIWAKLEWGRYWAWDYKETGALAILTWLLAFVAIGRARILSPRAIMMLAVLGNIVAFFGWFGANLWSNGQVTPLYTSILWGATLVHVIVALLAFLPPGTLRPLNAR